MGYIAVYSDNRTPIEELVAIREKELEEANAELDRTRRLIPLMESQVIDASNRLGEAKRLLEALNDAEE